MGSVYEWVRKQIAKMSGEEWRRISLQIFGEVPPPEFFEKLLDDLWYYHREFIYVMLSDFKVRKWRTIRDVFVIKLLGLYIQPEHFDPNEVPENWKEAAELAERVFLL